jgi:hypothetical protein
LAVYATPTRGFTAAVSVFRGTPPAKPLICKSWSNHRGALNGNPWAYPTGEKLKLLGAIFNVVRSDIIETSFYNRSQSFTFRYGVSLLRLLIPFGKQKTLLTRGKQGDRNPLSILYLLTFRLSQWAAGFCPPYSMDNPRLNVQPELNRLCRVAFATDKVGQIVVAMLMQVFIERG